MNEEEVARLLREGKMDAAEAALRARPRSPWASPPRLVGLVVLAAGLGAGAYLAGRAFCLTSLDRVRNGGFERGETQPDHWIAHGLSGEARFLLVEGEAPEGRRFGRIHKGSGRVLPIDSWVQDLGAWSDARCVEVSLWARATRLKRAVVALLPYGEQERLPEVRVAVLQGTTGWTRIQVERRLPRAVRSVVLALQMVGSGELDVDGVRVRPIDRFRFQEGEELLENGGFESREDGAIAGWRTPQTPDGVRAAVEGVPGRPHVAVVSSTIDLEWIAFAGWEQRLERFPVSADVVLSADVRVSAPGIADVELIALDDRGETVLSASVGARAHRPPTLEGRRYEKSIRVPDAAEVLVVRCALEGKGISRFDDVSLRAAGRSRGWPRRRARAHGACRSFSQAVACRRVGAAIPNGLRL
jgi:hypothetical protein